MRITEHEKNAIIDAVKNADPNAQVWLFGSRTDDSKKGGDIDIAIFLNSNAPVSFETEVKLMTCRKCEETLIEPHIFLKSDFDKPEPLMEQIVKFGELIYL